MQSISLRQRLLSTRGGTLAVGVVAAALATLLLVVYLNRYRHNLNARNATVSVLVAKNLITKGTPGEIIGSKVLFQATAIPRAQLKDGALSDPSSLRGEIALADIFPGQQLTAASFGVLRSGAIAAQLSGDERAVAIPLDVTHGLLGQAQPGDHVDVLIGVNAGSSSSGAQGPLIKTLFQNISILSTSTESLTLRVTDVQANRLAWASDNGKIWVTLRPPAAAKQSRPQVVSLTTILVGGPR